MLGLDPRIHAAAHHHGNGKDLEAAEHCGLPGRGPAMTMVYGNDDE
jgi:hypothetical protein